jgi:putative ABC transport system permease protein
VLFISANSFVTYLIQASEGAGELTDYDIGFATVDMADSKMLPLYEELKTAAGVYQSSYQALMKYSSTVKASDLSDAYWEVAGAHSPDETVHLPVDIQFLDDSAYLQIVAGLGLPVEQYIGQNAKMIAVAKMQDTGNQVEGVDQLNELFTRSSMNLPIAPETNGEPKTEQEQDVTITFVETVPPDTLPILEKSEPKPYFFRVMAPYSLKARFETPGSPVTIKGLTFRSENPAQSAAEMETMIQGAGITASEYNLYNVHKMLDENRNIIFIVNVFAYTFIVMISLIAVANVFNTISTNIKLRRRELAMLRSVGMSDRDFNKMMNFECAFYGMRALLFGLPIAVVASWLIYVEMVNGGADNIDFVFPWGSMAISVFSVLFVVFITMLYAVNELKRENIIDALRDDLT